MRISSAKVSLAEWYRPAQVCAGEYSIASVGEWKPGKNRRSCRFFSEGETSARERTKEGEYGTSLRFH